MAKVRKISCDKRTGRNYYLVDSNFLANKHIQSRYAPTERDKVRLEACHAWWKQIDEQLDSGYARVYTPDICIAEAFKVLAKKYFREGWFPNPAAYGAAKRGLSRDVSTPDRHLRAQRRDVRFHDISTNRDIIVSVDRFFEIFHRHGKNVGVVDLILVATAKYLIDFYDIPKQMLHVVTLDNALREGLAKITEVPNAYDPTRPFHRAELVFEYAVA
jgi:predicted nucleic acid-binding protein